MDVDAHTAVLRQHVDVHADAPGPYQCTACGGAVPAIVLGKAPERRLALCHHCGSIADPYPASDAALTCIDMLLLRRSAYRHILVNHDRFYSHEGEQNTSRNHNWCQRTARESPMRQRAISRLLCATLLLDAWQRLYTDAWVELHKSGASLVEWDNAVTVAPRRTQSAATRVDMLRQHQHLNTTPTQVFAAERDCVSVASDAGLHSCGGCIDSACYATAFAVSRSSNISSSYMRSSDGGGAFSVLSDESRRIYESSQTNTIDVGDAVWALPDIPHRAARNLLNAAASWAAYNAGILLVVWAAGGVSIGCSSERDSGGWRWPWKPRALRLMHGLLVAGMLPRLAACVAMIYPYPPIFLDAINVFVVAGHVAALLAVVPRLHAGVAIAAVTVALAFAAVLERVVTWAWAGFAS